MADKIDQRREAMTKLAAEFAGLMEQNDELGRMIYAVQEADGEGIEDLNQATYEFKCHVAQIVGSLAMISGHIDNTSASHFLMEVAKQFIDFNIEQDPMDVLRGLVEGQ